MDPLTLALMASIPQMLGGVLAKGEHSKYAKLLDSTKTKVPESMGTARGIFEGLSEQGLPGFESTKSDILGTVGSSMEMAKGATDSPAALLGAITSAQGNVAGEIRKLGVQDEAAGLQNKLNFANFLSKVQAPTEMNVEQYNQQMKLAAGKERMLGTSELLGGISQGVGSGISAYGAADMREKFSEMFTNFGGDETPNTLKSMPSLDLSSITSMLPDSNVPNINERRTPASDAISNLNSNQPTNMMDYIDMLGLFSD